MSNWCSCWMELGFSTKHLAKEFEEYFLIEEDTGHNKPNVTVKFRDTDNTRYMFDVNIEERLGKSVYMLFETKWGIDNEDMLGFAERLYNEWGVDWFVCQFEEFGNQIYGKFTLMDNELVVYLVTNNEVWEKVEKCEETECIYDELDRALDDAVCEPIGTLNQRDKGYSEKCNSEKIHELLINGLDEEEQIDMENQIEEMNRR